MNLSVNRLAANNLENSPQFSGFLGLCISKSFFFNHFPSAIHIRPVFASISYTSFCNSLSSSIIFSSQYYYGTSYSSAGINCSSSSIVSHCSFTNITSSGSGAAISISSPSLSLTVSNCIFFNCVAASLGGSIYANALSFKAEFCCFESGGLSSISSGSAIYAPAYIPSAILSYCSSVRCPTSSYSYLSSTMTIMAINGTVNNINVSLTQVSGGGGIGIELFCTNLNQGQFYVESNCSSGSIMSIGFSSHGISSELEFVNNTNVAELFWLYSVTATVENSVFINTGIRLSVISMSPVVFAISNCTFDISQLSLTTVANVSITNCDFAKASISTPKYHMMQTANCWGIAGTSSSGFSVKYGLNVLQIGGSNMIIASILLCL